MYRRFRAGRIINPRTAHGQLVGGMIWGIGSALHENSDIDDRNAGYINAHLADDLLPVNADIVVDVRTIMVPEGDKLTNRAGVKGFGGIGVVGVAAAISNAVFHATGRRGASATCRSGSSTSCSAPAEAMVAGCGWGLISALAPRRVPADRFG
jgi:CO/xanthine dehydrogenase Mo-binding subunit